MSTTTTRNSLVKPGYADAADIAVINTNMDTIDASFAKCNWAGTTAPTANEDSGDGYSIGSIWFDTTNHKLYIAETVGVGSATWRQIYPASSLSTADQIVSTLADGGVSPIAVTSKVVCTNLNADMVDGIHSSTIIQAGGSVALTGTLNSTLADGTAPITVTSKTVCTNLNADLLDGVSGSGYVVQTLADAKGDIIAASAADTWAKVTVGADGHTLVGDASATAGVSWQPIYSGESRNMIINPEFMINQTGISTITSTTNPANSDDTYVMDQWILLSDGNDVMDVWRSTALYPSAQYGTGCGASLLLQTETANKKAGILQIIPNQTARRVSGGVVSVRFWA